MINLLPDLRPRMRRADLDARLTSSACPSLVITD